MTDTTNPSLRDQAEALLALLQQTGADDEPFYIDDFVHRLLATYGKIAIIWCVEDVQSPLVRPDLTTEQAWEVLERARDKHDADWGVNWTTLETIADDLFPEDVDRGQKVVLPHSR
jgi:hypothetical protein